MTNDINKDETTFKDRQGTKWDLTLTFAGCRRIDNSDFSILGVKEGFSILEPRRDMFNKILGDTRLLMACVWAVVQPQVKDKLGIDPKTDYEEAEAAFYDRLDGSVLKECRDKFWGTLINFFPEQKTALSSLKKAYDSAQVKIGKELEMMEGDLIRIMEEQVNGEVMKMKTELETLRTGNVVGPQSSK